MENNALILCDTNILIEVYKAIHLIEEFTLSHNLNLPDALIASTAIHHDLKLFTLNSKDFKYMNQLELVNKS